MKSKNIMLSIMIASIGLLSYTTKAQENNTQQDSTQNEMQGHQMQHPKKDHIKMHNGEMVMIKDGKTMPVEKDMTMKNGTKCMTDGTYITKDGKRTMMKEGEMMDMNGKMMMGMKKNEDQ